MTDFVALYADLILKKLVVKIKKDTIAKDKATERKLENAKDGFSVRTQRHWKAAADSEFYYKEMVIGYERLKELDQAVSWSSKLHQDRFKFMEKYEDELETYNKYYKE